ncbi:unnamed protein product [Caenorhabditis bovis]|uniref:Uncharacterized protein n=1 Tax=Caenorhabditis bovis TaxID=2654633 RepID=A0A8S1EVQ0_9PELO|nr:unnamed protein product [Caenorhabditis bovis]
MYDENIWLVSTDGVPYRIPVIDNPNVPAGNTWHILETPGNRPVTEISLGTYSLWCTTSDETLWFSRVTFDDPNYDQILYEISADGYMDVGKLEFTKLSVNRKDQLFTISASEEKLQVRTGITKDEPSGKRFVKVVERATNKKWISVNVATTSFSIIPDYYILENTIQTNLQVAMFSRSLWRQKILARLQDVNDLSYALMNSVESKYSKLQLTSSHLRFEVDAIPCYFYIDRAGGKFIFQPASVVISSTFIIVNVTELNVILVSSSDLQTAYPSFTREPQRYLIYIKRRTMADGIYLSFTDDSIRQKCLKRLNDIIREYLSQAIITDDNRCYWSITDWNEVRWHCLSELKKDRTPIELKTAKSIYVEGHFQEIDVGAGRHVWALNTMGHVYALTPDFNPLLTEEHELEHRFFDEVTLTMYEYQHKTYFKTVEGWMSDGQKCPKFFSSLPSKNWRWIDTEWHTQPENWEYAKEADGEYSAPSTRRDWPDDKGTVAVVGLTVDGHLLLRKGVRSDNAIGTKWIEIHEMAQGRTSAGCCCFANNVRFLILILTVWAISALFASLILFNLTALLHTNLPPDQKPVSGLDSLHEYTIWHDRRKRDLPNSDSSLTIKEANTDVKYDGVPGESIPSKIKKALYSAPGIGVLLGIWPTIAFSNSIGIRKLFALYLAVSALLTVFLPLAVPSNFVTFFAVRLLQGVLFSVVFPVIGNVLVYWGTLNDQLLFLTSTFLFIAVSRQ